MGVLMKHIIDWPGGCITEKISLTSQVGVLMKHIIDWPGGCINETYH